MIITKSQCCTIVLDYANIRMNRDFPLIFHTFAQFIAFSLISFAQLSCSFCAVRLFFRVFFVLYDKSKGEGKKGKRGK